MMAGAEQHGAAFGHAVAGLRHRGLQIIRRDLRARRDVREIQADAGHDAFLQRIFVDRNAAFAEVPGRVDMGAGMVAHRDEHRRQPPYVAGLDEGVLVRLPQAVNDGRVAGIDRRALMESRG